jgi:hypothetical protein
MWVMFLLITVGSFTSGLLMLGKNPAFFLPQHRVWQLSTGGLLALAVLQGDAIKARLRGARLLPRLSPKFVADGASTMGLILILIALAGFNDSIRYPGWWGLIPTAGAALVIAAGPHAAANRLLLSRPLVVFIGLISYALYLWHWPLLAFRNIIGLGDDVWLTLVCLVASLVLAALTYRYVEQPLRRAPQRVHAPALVTGTLALGALGLLCQYEVMPPRNDNEQNRAFAAASEDWGYPGGMHRQRGHSAIKLFSAGDGNDKVLFIGDSNIEQYAPRIERVFRERASRTSIVFATLGGCLPIRNLHAPRLSHCGTFADDAMALANDATVTTVVFGAAWVSYLSDANFLSGGTDQREGPRSWDDVYAEFASMIRGLTEKGKTVWIVLNMPTGSGTEPRSAIHRSLLGVISHSPLGMPRAQFEMVNGPVREKLLAVAHSAGAQVIDPMQWMCDATTCRGETADGAPIYKDASHLRAAYVRDHAVFMDQVLGIETGSTR